MFPFGLSLTLFLITHLILNTGFAASQVKNQKNVRPCLRRWFRLESPHIGRKRVNFRPGQFFAEGGHHTRAGFNGMDYLRISRFRLPFRVRQVLRSHEPAMKSMGAAIRAMANNAILLKQTLRIHVCGRIIRFFDAERLA